MNKQKAFSLIELIIVIAIIAIITGIAWPMYIEYTRTNKRAEAVASTMAVASALTQFHSDNGSYMWDAAPGAATVVNAHNRYKPLVDVGTGNSNATKNNTCARNRGFRYSTDDTRYESCYGNYSIVVTLAGTNYTITTTAIGDQANDSDCTSITLTNSGVKGFTGSSSSSVRRCWGSD